MVTDKRKIQKEKYTRIYKIDLHRIKKYFYEEEYTILMPIRCKFGKNLLCE